MPLGSSGLMPSGKFNTDESRSTRRTERKKCLKIYPRDRTFVCRSKQNPREFGNACKFQDIWNSAQLQNRPTSWVKAISCWYPFAVSGVEKKKKKPLKENRPLCRLISRGLRILGMSALSNFLGQIYVLTWGITFPATIENLQRRDGGFTVVKTAGGPFVVSRGRLVVCGIARVTLIYLPARSPPSSLIYSSRSASSTFEFARRRGRTLGASG